MKVREIMTAEPRYAALDTTLEEIATMMKEEDVGLIPVVDDGEVTGLVTDRDIVVRCIAAGKDPSECTAEDIMSEEVRTITPDDEVDAAARVMGEAQIRRLPVIENGKLVGMLSIGDIAVKTGDDEDETTAETLEEVSQGVKPTRGEAQEGRMQRRNGGRGSQQPSVRGRNERSERRESNRGVKLGARGRDSRDQRDRSTAQTAGKRKPKRAEARGKSTRRRAS